MPSLPPVVLEDMGVVCALGQGRDAVWKGLVAGDTSHLTPRSDLLIANTKLFGGASTELPEIPSALSRHDCRNNQLVLAAYHEIQASIEAAIARFGADRVAIVVGTSTAGVAEGEAAVRLHVEQGRWPDAFRPIQLEYGGLSEFLADLTGVTGPAYSLSTACSTGAKALVSARRLLHQGVCDAVIAGAADSLCRLTANGFDALKALSADRSLPMSANRDGLNLGEGAALFLVTRDDQHSAGDAIRLSGTGESSDAHHISAPDPEGSGAEAAMRQALEDAGLEPEDIAYLNLHGTATPHNDAMEGLAVSRIFGETVPTSSTKPLVGHTLGASGALEAAFCWLVLDHSSRSAPESANGSATGQLPPHRFDGEPDPEIPKLRLVETEASPHSAAEPDADRPESLHVMTNSFGFGGSNCTLLMSRRLR